MNTLDTVTIVVIIVGVCIALIVGVIYLIRARHEAAFQREYRAFKKQQRANYRAFLRDNGYTQ